MEGNEHLSLRHLGVSFHTFEGSKQVLQIDELHIDRGESLGLVGESGSGKSVLALAILGLLRSPPASIEAEYFELGGRDLLTQTEGQLRAMRGQEVAMIFQDPMSSLNPVFTVGRQLVDVIRRRGLKGARAVEKSRELMSLVDLPDPDTILRKYPHQLSGGQRQRVIIALALSCGADFLIADEPTRNLDVTVQAGILKTIAALRAELGVTVFFLANNLSLVAAMCDRVGILFQGRIVETGTVEEVVFGATHPYTRTLLQAIPTRDEGIADRGHIEVASGAPPETSACPYYSRCCESDNECARQSHPELEHLGGTHYCACYHTLKKVKDHA